MGRRARVHSHHDHEWAGGRGFTTGPNPTGYTISGLGVDIDAQSGTLDPVADIYAAEAFSSRKGARDPQSPLASYQATAGIGGSPDRFAPRTAVSEKLHVEPGRTYVAYFQNAAAGYYQTPNASRGEDPGAEAGWALEVWPESHWPGFALREADVFKGMVVHVIRCNTHYAIDNRRGWPIFRPDF